MSNHIITAKNIDVYYADKQALFGVDLDIKEKQVTSLIGPSGCGKSTFFTGDQSYERSDSYLSLQRVARN